MRPEIGRRDFVRGAGSCCVAAVVPVQTSRPELWGCSIVLTALASHILSDDDSFLRKLLIRDWEVLPPCISRVLVQFIYSFCCWMEDRTRLANSISRLAGTACSVELECSRATYLALSIALRVLAPLLRSSGYHQHAIAIEAGQDPESIARAANLVWHDRSVGTRLRTAGHHLSCALGGAERDQFRWLPDRVQHTFWAILALLERPEADDSEAKQHPRVLMPGFSEFLFSTLEAMFALGDSRDRASSCEVGRAALETSGVSISCWAAGIPPVRRVMLVPACELCAGTGSEWTARSVFEAPLAPEYLGWARARHRWSQDGQWVEICCTGCNGDGRRRA